MISSSTAEASPMLEGPRPAHVTEREPLIEMINHIFRVSRGWEPTIATDWAHVYAPENLDNVMVICDRTPSMDGKPVASTGVWVSEVRLGDGLVRVGGINCVGTLPDYRRHGLGSHVMAAAQQRMVALNCHVGLLSTGIADWYRRLGWEEAGMHRTYRLNRGNVHLLPAHRSHLHFRLLELDTIAGAEEAGGLPASVIEPHVASEVVRLHNEQRFGAKRDVTGFCTRTAARRIQRMALLEDAGAVVAYLLLREHVVMEWAGAPEDVAALLAATYAALDDPQASASQRGGHNPTLQVRAPGWAHPLTGLLDQVWLPYHMDYLGMVLLLEPQALLDACGVEGVRIEAANGQTNGEYVVVAGRERVTLDRRQLTKHFFGPERVSNVGAASFPLRFWQWNLEMV